MSEQNGAVGEFDPEEGFITLPGGVIYGWTKNYDAFEFDESNRDIDPKNVDEKVKMIKEGKDYLKEFPIVVQDDGEGKWIVREGQHRVVAARQCDVTLYYFVSDRISSEDVIDINNSQHSWTAKDRLRHYVIKGRIEYLKLKEFWDRYHWIPLSVAINLCHYGDRAKMGFADGTYRANDVDFAKEVADLCLNLKPYTPCYKDSAFIGSVASCLEIEGFSADKLVHKVSLQTGKVRRHSNIDSYMPMWDEIYNFYQKEEDHLRIERINSSSNRRRITRRGKQRNK